MTQSAIMMKDQLAEIVSQRSRVWEDYDIAVNRESELTTLSRKLSDFGPTDTIANLTPNASPPDELQRAVTAIKGEFENIAHTEQQISTSQADIERIKTDIRTGYTWIIILVVIGVVVLVIWLSRMSSNTSARVLNVEQMNKLSYCFDEVDIGGDTNFSIFFEALV